VEKEGRRILMNGHPHEEIKSHNDFCKSLSLPRITPRDRGRILFQDEVPQLRSSDCWKEGFRGPLKPWN